MQVFYLQQAEVTRERVYAMHQSSIDGVEDMSALAELHEAAIMHNLYQRYQKDNIYVSRVVLVVDMRASRCLLSLSNFIAQTQTFY